MNLNHRIADKKEGSTGEVIYKLITYPLGYLIPLVLLGFGIYSVRDYIGTSWDTGSLSLVFLPIIGPLLGQLLAVGNNFIFSHIVLLFYVLGPLAFYAYTYFVTGRHLPAIIAGLLSLLPLWPLSFNVPERLILALQDKDGAHIIGLTLIPILGINFHIYLQHGTKKLQVLAITGGLVLGLISFFAYIVSLLFFFYISCSEALVSIGRIKLRRFFEISGGVILVFILAYNLSLISMLTSNAGQQTVKVLMNFIPMSFFLVPVLGTFAFLIFDRRPQLSPIFLAMSYTITFGVFHLVRISLIEVTLFDQSRYAAELSFSLSFLGGVVVMWVFEFIRRGSFPIFTKLPNRTRLYMGYGFVACLVLILVSSLFFIPRSF